MYFDISTSAWIVGRSRYSSTSPTGNGRSCATMKAMGLKDTLQSDLVAAMKAGDDVKKTTLRAVITSIKTAETAGGAGDEITDDEVMKIITTEVKQRTEAAEIFAEAGESEREAVEVAEREVLQAYLPEQLSSEELDAIVAKVIADGGYSTKKDMGTAIKEVMAQVGSSADGKTVSGAVGKALS